jgi:uncharacterized protein YdaU (DUF1376 family)
MHYFNFHIGNYLEDAEHLSWLQDAAYFRLIRKYMSAEAPLPADIAECRRLARAQTSKEREAVEIVLKEFFTLEEDGWHNEWCDKEVEAYQDRLDASDKKVGGEKARLQRSREAKKELFAQLRALGITPKWNAKSEQLRSMLRMAQRRVTTPVSEPVSPPLDTTPATDLLRTCYAPATTIFTNEPLTNNQEPEREREEERENVDAVASPALDPAISDSSIDDHDDEDYDIPSVTDLVGTLGFDILDIPEVQSTATPVVSEKDQATSTATSEPSEESPDYAPAAKAAASARATRIPENWRMSDADKAFAAKNMPHWSSEQIRRAGEDFFDYYSSIGGEKARRVDWTATFRSWIRKAPNYEPKTTYTQQRITRDEERSQFVAQLTGNHIQPGFLYHQSGTAPTAYRVD